jgi:phosphatidylglycerol:prolipoprotein diacylglycerol transferase
MVAHPGYALFMFLALAVFLLARHFVPRPAGYDALPWWQRVLLGVSAFVGGVLGAKVPFVIEGLVRGLSGQPAALPARPTPWWAVNLWFADGKTILAGLAGAYLGVEVGKLALGVRVKTGDSFAIPLALAMTVGRWGCFVNGCCYGTPTHLPWGVRFPIDDHAALRHPTQVYESLFHFAMALVLLDLLHRGALRRQRLKLYLIAYCVYRFLTEFIRDEPIWLTGLTFYQWAATVLAAALAVQWWLDRVPPAPLAELVREPA